jgi:7,8-dihydropterin-6-yl-methyl-4-(beta-D-ribofuranosyl)aminobenzene 5'-phosphate synthase
MRSPLRALNVILMCLCCAGCATPANRQHHPPEPMARENPASMMKITVVYDNNAHDPRLQTAWGFACVVQLQDTTILFDTGGDGSILLSNMERLGIAPRQIDMVVLSHIHTDHVGGLPALLTRNHDLTVVVPASFPRTLKQGVLSSGARLRETSRSEELAAHVWTTGELDGAIREQSLVVGTQSGLVIITGCAHPGITRIVKEVRQTLGGEIALALGGFHLAGKSERELAEIVEQFEELGVRHVAPCHCSGEAARAAFKQAYGDNCLPAGVGFTVDLHHLVAA